MTAALPSLRPVADGTKSGVVKTGQSTVDLWAEIDDDPDAHDGDATWIANADGAVDGSLFLLLTDTPADFVSMSTAAVKLAVRRTSIQVDDTVALYAQMFRSDETTALSDELQVGTYSTLTDTYGLKTLALTGLVAGDKTIWDGARLRLRWDYTLAVTDDFLRIRVTAAEVDGTYVPRELVVAAGAHGHTADTVTVAEARPIRVSIPAAVHTDYGASYPLTYAFALPAGSSGLTGQWRASPADPWTSLAEPGAGRFDGTTVARFDYPNNRAYLSVPFTATSDDLYLRIVTGAGNVVGTYLGVPRFYDNRRCAVVCTYDDWSANNHASFVAAAEAHRIYGLWMSPGINSGGRDGVDPLTATHWTDMQAAIDAGWLEPINHGRTHKNANNYVAGDAEAEIGGGAQDIKDNITMPAQSRRGATEYVQGWIRPFGITTAEVRSKLAEKKHLADRKIDSDSAYRDLALWKTDGLYDVQEPSAQVLVTAGDAAAATAAANTIKSRFDTAYTARLVFTVYSYPHHWPSWAAGSAGRDWLSYIGAFTDIWAVGFGHVYQYRLLAERITVEQLPDFRSMSKLPHSTTEDPITIPAGQVGDLLLGYHAYSGSGSVWPAGWTKLHDSRATTGLEWNQSAIWYRIADGTEPATITPTGSTNGAAFNGAAILRYSGIDNAAPVADWAINAVSVEGSSVVAPAVTPPKPGLVVRVFHATDGGKVSIPTAAAGSVQDRVFETRTSASEPAYALADHYVRTGETAAALTATTEVPAAYQHGWTIVLAAAAELAVDDTRHAHTAAQVPLGGAVDLTVANAMHGHAAATPALTEVHALAVANAQHTNTAGAPSLTQTHNLAAANAVHTHSAGSAALIQAHQLIVANAQHGHTATSAALTQVHDLTIASCTHGHTADNVAMSGAGQLGPAPATHGHTADTVTLAQVHQLTIQPATHGHTADQPGFGLSLSVANAAHAHAAGVPAVTLIVRVGTIPRPSTGTTARPFAGTTPRP